MFARLFWFVCSPFLVVGVQLALFARYVGLLPGDERYYPIRPNDGIFPQAVYAGMIVGHIVASIVLFFVLGFGEFLSFVCLAPFVEFLFATFVGRAVLEYWLRATLRRMTPVELEAYRAQLRK